MELTTPSSGRGYFSRTTRFSVCVLPASSVALTEGLARRSLPLPRSAHSHYDGAIMMRTQISLEAELHHQAKMRAAERGISLAEYLRHLVRSDLDPEPAGDASSLFDLGDSGGSDVATRKDTYLGEAVDR